MTHESTVCLGLFFEEIVLAEVRFELPYDVHSQQQGPEHQSPETAVGPEAPCIIIRTANSLEKQFIFITCRALLGVRIHLMDITCNLCK